MTGCAWYKWVDWGWGWGWMCVWGEEIGVGERVGLAGSGSLRLGLGLGLGSEVALLVWRRLLGLSALTSERLWTLVAC